MTVMLVTACIQYYTDYISTRMYSATKPEYLTLLKHKKKSELPYFKDILEKSAFDFGEELYLISKCHIFP